MCLLLLRTVCRPSGPASAGPFHFQKEKERMTQLINLTGQRFGRLTVLCRATYNNGGFPVWICRCDCTPEKELAVTGAALRSGRTKSDGCLRVDTSRNRG